MLKFALLGFLNYTAMTGYELEGWINITTGNFWHAELSQIYKTLKKLEEDGQVTSVIEPQEGKPDKRIYSITAAGKAALDAWLAAPLLDEVDKKDPLLLKLFFAQPTETTALLTMLRIQLGLHQQKLAHYQQGAPQAMVDFTAEHPALLPNTVLWEAARRHGVMYEEMYIKWIEETIAMLE